MHYRILSTVVIWLLIAAAIAIGKIYAGLALLIFVTAAAHWEFCTMLRLGGAHFRPSSAFSVALGVVALAGLCGNVLLGNDRPAFQGAAIDWMVPGPGLAIGAVSLALLFIKPARLVAMFSRLPAILSLLYIPFSILPLTMLGVEAWCHGNDLSGLLLGIWLVATVKFADCGALLVGLSFGEKRHRMAPSISPGKSWEGCAGALAAAALVGAGTAWLLAHFSSQLGWTLSGALTPDKAAAIGVVLAALGIPSDLIESVFKRHVKIKDSGKTIPGIGGAFDLLDSLVLTVPVGYVLLKLFVLSAKPFP